MSSLKRISQTQDQDGVSQCGFNPVGHGVKIYSCVCIYHRFDLELNQAQDEVQRERTQREKLGREKDMLTGEVFTIRQQLQVRCVCFAHNS